MRPLLFALQCLALVSCSETHTKVTGYAAGGLPLGSFDTRNWLYGKSQIDSTLFGVTHVTNLDIGFKAFVQGLAALAGAMYYGQAQLEKEVTSRLASAGLNQVQLAQIRANLAASLAKNGLDTTVAGINAGLFVPQGTVFKQP